MLVLLSWDELFNFESQLKTPIMYMASLMYVAGSLVAHTLVIC